MCQVQYTTMKKGLKFLNLGMYIVVWRRHTDKLQRYVLQDAVVGNEEEANLQNDQREHF